MPDAVQQIVVRSLSPRSTTGILTLGNLRMRCALGRSGVRWAKREGDGATPAGRWPIRRALYRADRLLRPAAAIPLSAIGAADGWCDAPSDRNYNRPVQHPYPASAERMWRDDGLYDVVVVLGHNDLPRRPGMGSAVFLHIARTGLKATEGCIAVAPGDMRRLLPRLRRGMLIRVYG